MPRSPRTVKITEREYQALISAESLMEVLDDGEDHPMFRADVRALMRIRARWLAAR